MNDNAVANPTQLIYSDQDDPLLVLRPAELRVVYGADAGVACELSTRRVTVGTAADNDLVLTDPGVSRCHVELQVHDRGFLVKDLRSTNGTFIGGTRVNEALVRAGSEIRLSSTVLRVEARDEASQRIGGREAFGGLVGASAAMQRVYGILAAVAPTDVTVLIEGETGSGKELVAEELHRHSPRRDRLFSVVDCGALPAELIESELFGHEKGAFTGASQQRIGVFERSGGGTVFLDEIGELPAALQTRLLRVLDRRTIKRVGGDLTCKVDIRLVAATNRDLTQEVQAGRFRQDLFYRLTVMRVRVPALRKRREDIPLLARHFLHEIGAPQPERLLTDELLGVFGSRRWPGNVRELRNVIERAVVMAGATDQGGDPAALLGLEEDQPTSPSDGLPAGVAHAPGEPAVEQTPPPREGWMGRALPPDYLRRPYRLARELVTSQFDTIYFGELVQRYGQNISAIAREAGLDRRQVRRLLQKHGLYGHDSD